MYGFDELIKLGYHIYFANNYFISQSKFSVTTATLYNYYDWIDKSLVNDLEALYLVHATDAVGSAPKSAKYMIGQHMRMVLCKEENKFNKIENFKEFSEAMSDKKNNITQYAYTGPYHLGEWEEKRKLPKNILREEIEHIVQKKLKKDLPLVVFYKDEISYWKDCADGINSIAKYANVIYKSINQKYDPICKVLDSSVIIWPSNGLAQNILRFGADIILAGYQSGTFNSSIMLGLNVIPYYTNHIYDKKNKKFIDFTYFLQKELINSLIIRETKLILNIKNIKINNFNNMFFDRIYKNKIDKIKRDVFFDFIIDGATKKTLSLILRAYNKGTFGDDTIAIRYN